MSIGSPIELTCRWTGKFALSFTGTSITCSSLHNSSQRLNVAASHSVAHTKPLDDTSLLVEQS